MIKTLNRTTLSTSELSIMTQNLTTLSVMPFSMMTLSKRTPNKMTLKDWAMTCIILAIVIMTLSITILLKMHSKIVMFCSQLQHSLVPSVVLLIVMAPERMNFRVGILFVLLLLFFFFLSLLLYCQHNAIQHDDPQHKDTQHNDIKRLDYDMQHFGDHYNNTQYNNTVKDAQQNNNVLLVVTTQSWAKCHSADCRGARKNEL